MPSPNKVYQRFKQLVDECELRALYLNQSAKAKQRRRWLGEMKVILDKMDELIGAQRRVGGGPEGQNWIGNPSAPAKKLRRAQEDLCGQTKGTPSSSSLTRAARDATGLNGYRTAVPQREPYLDSPKQ